MRRRSSAIIVAVGLALSSTVGNASLETDCYIAGGYFASTYFADNYFDESCSSGDPPSAVSSDGDKNLFQFPDLFGN